MDLESDHLDLSPGSSCWLCPCLGNLTSLCLNFFTVRWVLPNRLLWEVNNIIRMDLTSFYNKFIVIVSSCLISYTQPSYSQCSPWILVRECESYWGSGDNKADETLVENRSWCTHNLFHIVIPLKKGSLKNDF